MEDIEIIKLELAINGISILTDGQCVVSSAESETPITISCEEKFQQLHHSIKINKLEFKRMWNLFSDSLEKCGNSNVGGSPSTEKMYISSLKYAYKMTKKYRYFSSYKNKLKSHLNKDIKQCSESSMSTVIDYHLCMDWIYKDIKNDIYKINLFKAFSKLNQVKKAQQMTPSAMDLPMKERVWQWKEDEEDWDQRQKDIRNQQRYQLPETYNDPDSFEEGFYWREMRNDPYSFWDEENDPYPHYYNYKSKVHRGLE